MCMHEREAAYQIVYVYGCVDTWGTEDRQGENESESAWLKNYFVFAT